MPAKDKYMMLDKLKIQKSALVNAHKIVSYLEMDDLTYTHMSVRVDNENKASNPLEYSFFLTPFDSSYNCILADELIEIDNEHNVLSKNKNFNPTGILIHNAIYAARADINSVIHLHTNATIAIGALKSGLLPISQHALHFYKHISYHSYSSLVLSESEQALVLAKDLGSNNVMLLRNHGFITSGKTIQEALFYAYHLERACKIQAMISNINVEDLILPEESICENAYKDLMTFEKDLGLRDWKAWIKKLNL